jgi:hypothetical protein
MSTYQKAVLSEVLRQLKIADGSPMDQAVLHAKIEPHLFPAPTLSDLRSALATAEADDYITGRTFGPLETRLWAITPKGAMAHNR